jgi:hypothetical protein
MLISDSSRDTCGEVEIEDLLYQLDEMEMLTNSQHESLCESIVLCESLLSTRSHLETRIFECRKRRSDLQKEYSEIESELFSTQNELDLTARDQRSAKSDLDIDAAIVKLQDRVRVNRQRLKKSLTELLIRTDGEFI